MSLHLVGSDAQRAKDPFSPAFRVHAPDVQTSPLVFSSPHSGRFYPPEFIDAARLPLERLRRSEDAFVEELFLGVTAHGAPLIAAHYPRAFLDLNREPFELDPDLFVDSLPHFANTRSLRVLGGLGTIARVVGESEEIYRRRLTVAEAMTRIDQLYWPYHAELGALIERTRRRFGFAVLIDCHSMPSGEAGPGPQGGRSHFVLGDRFGTSCAPEVTQHVSAVLSGLGFSVGLNRPYAGGYITEHYGAPGMGVHALQIEIRRDLFTHEELLTPTADFSPLQASLMESVGRLSEFSRLLQPMRAAAE